MKNKYLKFLFFLICLVFVSPSSSEEFNLKSKNIEVFENGNLLKASGNVEILINNNFIINSDNSILDKNKSFLETTGNVILIDSLRKIRIEANKITYDKINNLAIVHGKGKAYFENLYYIESDDIYFDNKNDLIYSNKFSKLIYNDGTNIAFEKFNLNTKNNILKVNNLELKDLQRNVFKLEEAAIDIKKNEIIGKDAKLFFNKQIFGNQKNDPRLFGNSLIDNKSETIVYKGIFTSCEYREKDKCPPWTIKSDIVKHNKSKKIIEYKNAWLNIYDKPVIYFPYFYHPDPTVKRQSGFLMPRINNSSFLGSSLQIPYYNVISENKDMTFSPRIFFNDKLLFQTEYRQANKNSKFNLDHSINTTNESSNSHFFSNFKSETNNKSFEINLETTSNKNYLKKYDIKSPLIDDYITLNSFSSFEVSAEDYDFLTSIEVFEDLTKNNSDSYEYIYPNYNFRKLLSDENKGSLYFSSSGYQKKYDTNSYDGVFINDLKFISDDLINDKGFVNNYSFVLKNVNSDGTNSKNYKNNFDNKLLSSFIYNTKYPLFKQHEKTKNYFTPFLSARFSPTETKNIRLEDKNILFSGLFEDERIDNNDMIEGGESLTIGGNYTLKNSNNNEIFNFSAGQVYRVNENSDLPVVSSIGKKTSDLIGQLKFAPSDIFNINYSFSIDNNFNKSNHNFSQMNFNFNTFNSSFEFLSSNNELGDKSYISNETKINLKENSSIAFGTNKNLDIDMTEYYNLIYEYKNDCLTAAIEYKKLFYEDTDISGDESIFFSIKIVPVGAINSPSIE